MPFILNLFKLIRINNCLLASVGVIVGAHLTEGAGEYYRPLMAALAAFFVCAAGNVQNDLVDIEIDRINRPQRALVTGALSKKQGRAIFVALLILSVLFGYLSGLALLPVLLFALLMLHYYNLRGKRQFLIGNLIVSLLGGLLFLVGGLAVDFGAAISLPGPIVAAVVVFLVHLTREIVKDIEDMSGDESVTLNTLPLRWGVERTSNLLITIFILLAAVTLLPSLTGWYSIWYTAVATLGVLIPTAISLARLRSNPVKATASAASLQLKLSMLLGIAALLLA